MRVRIHSLLALVFLAPLVSAAQPAVTSTAIELKDGLIWVSVHSSSRPLNFVVDSGAAATVISLRAARELHLDLGAPLAIAGVGTTAVGWRVANFQADLAGIALSRNVVVTNLTAVSRGCTQQIDGLLGADFFKNRTVQINYSRREMYCAAEAVATGRNVLPLRIKDGVMTVPVTINGEPARWTRLDTGCTDGLHWSAATRSHRNSARQPTIALASNDTANSATVQLGQDTLRDVGVTFHPCEIFSGEAGLLGNGVLSKFRVTIDAPHRRVILD